MFKFNKLVVGVFAAGALTFGMATSASAEHIATNDVPSASYSIESSLSSDTASDLAAEAGAGPLSQTYNKPWGAKRLASIEAAGPLNSSSEITVDSVDYWKGASQGFAVTVSSTYGAGPLSSDNGWQADFPSAETPLIGSSI